MKPTRGAIRLGSVAGVGIFVQLSWFVFAGLISLLLAPVIQRSYPHMQTTAYLAGFGFAILLYVSILLHEISHALMAQFYRLRVRRITLHFVGGATEIEGEARTPAQEFWVAVVGPLTSIGVGVASLLMARLVPTSLLQLGLLGLAWANLLVGVLNLVPGLPLDGGRVLRALIWKVTGNAFTATLVAGWAGRLVAVTVIAWPMIAQSIWSVEPNLWQYFVAAFIGVYLWVGASSAMQVARVRRRLPQLQARQLARRCILVDAQMSVAEAVLAAQSSFAGSIVIRDGVGGVLAVVSEQALIAVPHEHRQHVHIGQLARSVTPGLRLPADIAGEKLVLAMTRYPASEYVLLEPDGTVYGVLVSADVDAAFKQTSHR